MELTVKVIGVLVAIVTVVSLVGVLTGWQKWNEGTKNDDPNKSDQGLKAMVLGGIGAVVAAGIGAAIITQINSISF